MARTPAPWLPFPQDPPPEPAETSVPPDSPPSPEKGDRHAVQDDRSGTPPATPGDLRPAPPAADAAAGAGPPRQGAESQPRSLDGPTLPGEAGERVGPGGERGAGDRPPG